MREIHTCDYISQYLTKSEKTNLDHDGTTFSSLIKNVGATKSVFVRLNSYLTQEVSSLGNQSSTYYSSIL